jgi:hypothetical protein
LAVVWSRTSGSRQPAVGQGTGQSLESAVASDNLGSVCRPQQNKNLSTEEEGEDVAATE